MAPWPEPTTLPIVLGYQQGGREEALTLEELVAREDGWPGPLQGSSVMGLGRPPLGLSALPGVVG